MGIFAEALAAAMNPSCAGGNHAAIYVEHQVIGWFRELLGFPAASAGLLVSGGSMATMTALAVARHVKSGVDVRVDGLRGAAPAAFYLSTEAHSCARKAIELLGFGSASVRTIATDARLPDAGRGAGGGDRRRSRGRRPADRRDRHRRLDQHRRHRRPRRDRRLCRRHGVWMHVDAAYGGPAILSTEYAGALRAIAQADSVALDPHKWLFVPVEAGLVLVRDAEAMRSTFSLVPPYIRQSGSAGEVYGLPWFSEYGFQQTRGFRALKVWMTMQQFGLNGFREAIEENLSLARYLAECVRNAPELELVAPPSLSVVCFRFVGVQSNDRGEKSDADERTIASVEPCAAGAAAAGRRRVPHQHRAARPLRAPRLHRQLPQPDGGCRSNAERRGPQSAAGADRTISARSLNASRSVWRSSRIASRTASRYSWR